MKILLTTLNAKYIQTNLALRYLYESAYEYQEYMELKEFTINQEESYIYNEIIRGNYDIICISSYIWNISKVKALVADIKKVKDVIVILGGPEVSYDSEALIREYPYIDYIIRGEGEKTFYEIISLLISKKGQMDQINGITYRSKNQVVSTPDRASCRSLDDIPFPYRHFSPEKDRIIYYETSRGCRFNCSYCLSSINKGVRTLSLERVKEELSYFINREIPQVKFVDRTFNLNPKRCLKIIKYIQEIDKGKTNFHLEINGDLLDEEILEVLSTARKGLFQFEIGVQSTWERTIEAVGRKTDFKKLKKNVQKIYRYQNIHFHLDLIAGLPFESFDTFKKSFNDVYELNPHMLQLGFLKLLKGSRVRNEALEHLYCYQDKEPYEILSNKYISAIELVKLKMLEDILEKYYNRSGFQSTLKFVIKTNYENPFSFYDDFSEYWYQNGYHHMAHSKDALYDILLDFYIHRDFLDLALFKEFIMYDRMLNSSAASKSEGIDKETIHDILHNEIFRNTFLTRHQHLKVKELKKFIGYQLFEFNIHGNAKKNQKIVNEKNLCFFDYSNKDLWGQAFACSLTMAEIEEVKG